MTALEVEHLAARFGHSEVPRDLSRLLLLAVVATGGHR